MAKSSMLKSVTLKSALAGATLALGTTLAGGASAAPQVLAALEHAQGVPFHCYNGTCKTDLTTFCLQQERDVPTVGTAYTPAQAEQFVVRVTNTEGESRDLPAAELVTFASNRGFSSVNVHMDQAKIEAFGFKHARLIVNENASLVPVPADNDPNPLGEAEVVHATTSLREMGTELVDRQPSGVSARMINQLAAMIVNFNAPASDQTLERLWNDVVDDMAPELEQAPGAKERARQAYDRCGLGWYHSMGGVKDCLNYRHDEVMQQLNGDYWDKQPGS